MSAPWGGRRAQAARAWIASTLPRPCSKCGQPVHPWHEWDLDHLRDRHRHPELTWQPSNWAAAHSACNRSAGAAAGNRARTRPPITAAAPHLITQVSGPPCSGKSTWIREHARPGDLIIDDVDLADACGGRDRISAAEWRAWRERKDQTIATWTEPGRLWIIQGDPTPRAPGIDVHVIDIDKATCHRRANDDGRPAVTHLWITRWFKRHGGAMAGDHGEQTWTAPGW